MNHIDSARCTCGYLAVLVLCTALSPPLTAAPSVLIMDCALRDDTLLPDVADELARTAAVAPVVRRRLQEIGYTVPDYIGSEENLALTENGYFLAHPAIVADLGRAHDADWVGICTQFKFSFLVSILRVHLIDVGKDRVITHAETWMRGAMNDARITRRSSVSLADQVHDLLHAVESKRAEGAEFR